MTPYDDPDAKGPDDRGITRSKRTAVIALAVLSVVLVGVGIAGNLSVRSPSGPVLVGRTGTRAPGFALPTLTGRHHTVTLSELRGKDLVVNFWASWCIPCRTEMPLLESTYLGMRSRVQFIGIDTNDPSRQAALAFLVQTHVTYTTLFDPHGTAADLYSLQGMPTTVFISTRGRVLGRHIGQLDAPTLRSALARAFGPAVAG